MAEAAKMEKELVQEIFKRGDQIPEKYLLKEGYPEAIDSPPHLWTHTLLLDFSLLSSSPPHRNELEKLRSALSDWGCFQVINHGIENSLLDELIQVSKQFFTLPLEEKLKCYSRDNVFQGYGTGSSFIGTDPGNWNDRLLFTLHPEEHRQLELWPERPQEFRDTLLEFSTKITNVFETILKAMAMSLDLEDANCLLEQQGRKKRISSRITYFPPCPCPQHVLGHKPHSDGSTMSILMADKEAEGFHVQKDDQWFKVPSFPGALFINVGDFGEVLSNGIFKSVVNRVATSSTKDRISVGVFLSPDREVEIAPIDELVDQHQAQLYKKFNMGDCVKEIIKNSMSKDGGPVTTGSEHTNSASATASATGKGHTGGRPAIVAGAGSTEIDLEAQNHASTTA